VTAHAVFSASGAERWANCPGSIVLSRGIANTDSLAAREGTAGHELGDRCLKDGTDPVEHVGEIVLGIEITDELASAVQDYVDYVRTIPGARLYEQRVNYAVLLGVDDEEGFGTLDSAIMDDTVLHIIDAKFGRKYVDPILNKQMMLYGAALVFALEAVGETVTEIQLHVVQPRVVAKPAPCFLTREQLAEQVEYLRAAAQGVIEADAAFTSIEDKAWCKRYLHPGETQCQYCPAAPFCPALRNMVSPLAAQASEFEIVTMAESFDPAELARRLSLVPLAEIWIKAIRHESFSRLSKGAPVPGYKLVTGREGNRKWSNAEAIAAAAAAFADLPKEVTHKPAELKSPAQLEKALPKARREEIMPFISRAPARPTLAEASDPRAPWVNTAGTDEFDMVE
jgi:hypothetical protein